MQTREGFHVIQIEPSMGLHVSPTIGNVRYEVVHAIRYNLG